MITPPVALTATISCRALSAGAAVLALVLALVAVALSPPFLEEWILADHDLGDGGGERDAWVVAAGLALLAILAAALARSLWTRAGSIPPRRLRTGIVVFFSTTLFVGLGAEIFLRCTRSPDQVLSGDAYWIHRWNTRRAPGHDALQIEGGLHRHDPGLGWIPAGGYYLEGVSTNSRGLRGATEYAVPKPTGMRRIVVMGDSFTWGLGVRDEETWPAVLQTLLDDVEVLNLGVIGYGTDQQYLRLGQEGLRYEPDLVILGFFGPDTVRNVRRFRDSGKPRFAVEGGRLRLENVPVPDPELEGTSIDPQPFSYAGALCLTKLRAAIDRTLLAPKWAVTRAILDGIQDNVRERGAELLVAHFPTEPAAFRSRPEDSELFLDEWARARNEPIVRLREVFLDLSPAERSGVFEGHFSAFGNVVVARAIARAIAEGKLLGSKEGSDR